MYNLKIIKSGKRIEIFKVNNYLIRKKADVELYEPLHDSIEDIRKEIRKEKKENKPPGETKKRDRNRSLRDARNNIVRLIKANEDMKTFITLTFREETDYKISKKYLNGFFTKLRQAYQGLKYLWVIERGDLNNRIHYHVLCNIPIKVKLSPSERRKSEEHKRLENYFADKYWKYGFVDIRELQQEENTNIALYVSEYITKSMQNKDLEGYRIYGYSHKTLNKPVIETSYTKKTTEEILDEYKNYKVNYVNSYDIGYTSYDKTHKGIVNYFDLEEI